MNIVDELIFVKRIILEFSQMAIFSKWAYPLEQSY